MKKIYLTLILAVIFSSCHRYKTLKHYVNHYVIEVEESADGHSNVVIEDRVVDGLITVILQSSKSVGWENVSKAELSEYLTYAKKHNDLAWNREVYPRNATDLKAVWFGFTANQVIDITVTAESDWDAKTPKGSSLDDKFLFLTASPDEYLKNGYQLDINKIETIRATVDPRLKDVLDACIDKTLQTSLPVYGVLSKIDFSNYQLLGVGGVWFSLMPIDKLTKGAEISIKITFDNGKVITYNHKCHQ